MRTSIATSKSVRGRTDRRMSAVALPYTVVLTGELSPVGNRKKEEVGMLEILKYIFSSFWVFSGTVVLIWSIGIMLTLIFYAIFGDSKKK